MGGALNIDQQPVCLKLACAPKLRSEMMRRPSEANFVFCQSYALGTPTASAFSGERARCHAGGGREVPTEATQAPQHAEQRLCPLRCSRFCPAACPVQHWSRGMKCSTSFAPGPLAAPSRAPPPPRYPKGIDIRNRAPFKDSATKQAWREANLATAPTAHAEIGPPTKFGNPTRPNLPMQDGGRVLVSSRPP